VLHDQADRAIVSVRCRLHRSQVEPASAVEPQGNHRHSHAEATTMDRKRVFIHSEDAELAVQLGQSTGPALRDGLVGDAGTGLGNRAAMEHGRPRPPGPGRSVAVPRARRPSQPELTELRRADIIGSVGPQGRPRKAVLPCRPGAHLVTSPARDALYGRRTVDLSTLREVARKGAHAGQPFPPAIFDELSQDDLDWLTTHFDDLSPIYWYEVFHRINRLFQGQEESASELLSRTFGLLPGGVSPAPVFLMVADAYTANRTPWSAPISKQPRYSQASTAAGAP
jgi:hypothetical protein